MDETPGRKSEIIAFLEGLTPAELAYASMHANRLRHEKLYPATPENLADPNWDEQDAPGTEN